MAINKYHKMKRCRFLELDPAVVGCYKKSIRTSGRKSRKVSEYGLQLREKQKTKRIYGVQWHPERMVPPLCEDVTDENHLPLFRWLCEQC